MYVTGHMIKSSRLPPHTVSRWRRLGMRLASDIIDISVLASPQALPKNWERGLVTLAKIPVCAVSAILVLSRGITFVYC